MQPNVQRFGVFLERDGEKRFVEMPAEGRHLAADMAEKAEPGWSAVAVTLRHDVAGRCARCSSIVFTDERPRRDRGRVRCFEC